MSAFDLVFDGFHIRPAGDYKLTNLPPATGGYPDPTIDEPDPADLSEMVFDSICEATDGCTVEPDGTCEHGHPSWLLHFGLI